jgi:hypothetical protein
VKRILLASLVLATSAASLAACSAAPPLMPVAEAPKAAATEGNASITLRTQIVTPARRLLADLVTPWGVSDVKRLTAYLFKAGDEPSSLTDNSTLPTGEVAFKNYDDTAVQQSTSINFTNLKNETNYKVLALALDRIPPGAMIINYDTAIANMKSIVAKESNGIQDQEVDSVTVTVQLDDKPFSGYANGNTIDIQGGGLSHTGSEGIEDAAP